MVGGQTPTTKLAAVRKSPRTQAITVKAGDNLQTALDSAKPGDVLALEAGATFKGNFILPKKDSDATITITSTAANNLRPGMRVKPSDAENMPRIISPNVARPLPPPPVRIIGA